MDKSRDTKVKKDLNLDPYKGLQFYNGNELGLKANISEFIGLEFTNSELRVSTETHKLSIYIDPLKAMLHKVLGDYLTSDLTTKRIRC